MWKFKSWKGRDKWLFLLTIGVILCILAFPADSLTKKSRKVQAHVTDGAAVSGSEPLQADGWMEDQNVTKESGSEPALPVSAKVSNSYEAELEARVREILTHVDGVGTVDVMIVLKSSAEKVIHTDSSSSFSTTEEQDSGGGVRKIGSEEKEDTTVLVAGEGQGNTPIVEKELRPELSGIIISASGGGSPTVRAEISAAMEALFDLPAHKIKVLKRVE